LVMNPDPSFESALQIADQKMYENKNRR